MAGKKKKDWTAMTFKLDERVAGRLSEYNQKTGIPMTLAVERALEIYLDDYDKTGQVRLPGDGGNAYGHE